MPPSLRSLPPAKKRKLDEDSESLQAIKSGEEAVLQALSSNTSLNPLADLVHIALRAEGAQETSKCIYALYRIFVTIITEKRLITTPDENAKVIKRWIWERLNTYTDLLGGLLKDEERTLRLSSLQILFSLLKHLSSSATQSSLETGTKNQPQLHVAYFRRIVGYLLLCPPSKRAGPTEAVFDANLDADVRNRLVSDWLNLYDDIRWFFLRDCTIFLVPDIIQKNPHVPTNLLSILEMLSNIPIAPSALKSWWIPEFESKPPKPKRSSAAGGADSSDESEEPEDDTDDWRKFFDDDQPLKDSAKPTGRSVRLHQMTVHQSLYSLNSHRAVFTRAWLTLLPQLSIDPSSNRSLAVQALNIMHRGILPHLTRPILVMDWVGACVDYGGTAGLLALNALFVLMQEYNLDYPSFYTKLYAFLDRDVLHVKYRARFFRLTELFLSSTHLPAAILASFIKRLARLSLNASPSAIIMVIPFTYNVLKRHPALMVMIHQTSVPENPSIEPFNPSEPRPLHTGAIDSSLWELHTHRSHYHSAVSTLTKVFEEAFTKPGYSMEDFLDHTYNTLMESDVNRKVKQEPPVSIQIELQSKAGKELFLRQCPAQAEAIGEASAPDDIINELWTFG